MSAATPPEASDEAPAVQPPPSPDPSEQGAEAAASASAASVAGGGGGAKEAKEAQAKRQTNKKDSYTFTRPLGYGSYSRVVLAQHKVTNQTFAVKIVSKLRTQQRELLKSVLAERDVLRQCSHPNIIKLVETFQSSEELFYVMECASGGELLAFIKKFGRFDQNVVRHVTAELVNALSYLHGKGIVHRDLKPENILFDSSFHVKLVDFGTAFIQKPGDVGQPSSALLQRYEQESRAKDDRHQGSVQLPGQQGTSRGQSFCGTFQYISPELIDKGVATPASDLWALGCVVYQMTAGHRPIDDGSVVRIFNKIRNPERHVVYAANFPPRAKDLVSRLLVVDPDARLGSPLTGGYPALRAHVFFEGIDFEALPTQKLDYCWRPAPPVWVSDGSVSKCRGCGSSFTLTNRRHHCRKCGDIFCHSCSRHQVSIPGLYSSKVRVCDGCHQSLQEPGVLVG